MELRHLNYFVAVAREQNITRAAARLHVSQPPLSRQIRQLEEELGVALFERSPKALRLTAAGRVFLAEAEAVLQRAEQAVQIVRAAAGGRTGEIKVAYAPSLTVQILPETLRHFQTRVPGARVHLYDLSTEEMLKGLRQGDLDVALMIQPNHKQLRGVSFEELYSYPLYVAAHPTHPLARARKVPLQKLIPERLIGYSRADYPEYYEKLAAIWRPSGQTPKLGEEHDSSTSLIAAVEAGRGVALVPASLRCLAGPRLKLRPLNPPAAPLVVGLARKKTAAPKLVEEFAAAARACKGRHTEPQF